LLINDLKQYEVLLVTGIASPKPFESYVRQHAASVQTISFPDHHAFSERDITLIADKWHNILSVNKIVLTTEKDAVRLQQMKIPEVLAKCSYYIPIEMNFIDETRDFLSDIRYVHDRYSSDGS